MFSKFNNRNISKLYMQRHGWVKPEFELRDDVYSYGKLTFKTVSIKHAGTATLADGLLNFKLEGFWQKRVSVVDGNDVLVGKLKIKAFSSTAEFILADGTIFYLKRSSFWKARYTWRSDAHGPLLHIHCHAFTKTDEVFIEQSTAPLAWVPLLSFVGFYLIITKQRQAAAAGV
ncbi:hypothetical protein IM792_04985 [Mucilaginibacter sp. JRF]|uniref:hypothetical protein n=1 Tax=Mucilaginibacter sp. JRF TaxID=2780088 RepID=UPI00187FDA90|nr:hypothetical protein [Mucilaginibacter sp. JRF]MBE9583794.1 hypothetical protein [Mucilaginibacter sp. JRF]